jgi:DNA end-binding protein Ku
MAGSPMGASVPRGCISVVDALDMGHNWVMARTIWTGMLSFGLVNVPVGIYSATDDKSIHFNQFEAGTSDRIRYRRVNERTGEEVDFSKIVKGYDLGAGEYVIVTDAEMEAVAPEKTRLIDVVDFVDDGEIDPIYYRTTYFLAPQGEPAKRAYSLLREAMAETNKVGIATFVMRGKEYLVAVRPRADILTLETMYFADEVRDPRSELPNIPEDEEFGVRELSTAKLLIDSMTRQFEAAEYVDTYRARLLELIDQKRQGQEIVTEIPELASTKVIDLMEALQASVKAAGSRRTAAAPSAKAPRAKKTAATARVVGPKKTAPNPRVVAAKKATPAAKTAKTAKQAPAAKATRQRKAS